MEHSRSCYSILASLTLPPPTGFRENLEEYSFLQGGALHMVSDNRGTYDTAKSTEEGFSILK